jgi:hypothetical protein
VGQSRNVNIGLEEIAGTHAATYLSAGGGIQVHARRGTDEYLKTFSKKIKAEGSTDAQRGLGGTGCLIQPSK